MNLERVQGGPHEFRMCPREVLMNLECVPGGSS